MPTLSLTHFTEHTKSTSEAFGSAKEPKLTKWHRKSPDLFTSLQLPQKPPLPNAAP